MGSVNDICATEKNVYCIASEKGIDFIGVKDFKIEAEVDFMHNKLAITSIAYAEYAVIIYGEAQQLTIYDYRERS